MDSTIQYVYANQVLNLIDLSEHRILVGSQRILKINICTSGQVATFKARLVANVIIKCKKLNMMSISSQLF